jgi:hypothetical protein
MWSNVFVNLSDFGAAFAHGARAVPNPFGPIVFQIQPSALGRAVDAAFCLRSAGARDFDREGESLSSLEDIELLFRNPAKHGFPRSSFLRFGDQLREAFAPRYPTATSAEVSLTMDPELIPVDDVIAIWVDATSVGGHSLLDAVTALVPTGMRVHPRYYWEERAVAIDDIVRTLADEYGRPSLRTLAGRADLAESTRAWAQAVLERDLDWQFQRYASYLIEGTLRRLPAAETPSTEPVMQDRWQTIVNRK